MADLDRDGWPDLILCHHDDFFARVYYNNRGRFSRGPFSVWADTHAIVPAPVSPTSKKMRFSLSVGGAYGRFPTRPQLFEATPSRKISNITTSAGVDKAGGRGRTAIYMDLSLSNNHKYLDVVFMNARPNDNGISHFAYKNKGSHYQLRSIPGFEYDRNWYGTAIDVDGDRNMELIVYYNRLSVYKLTAPFTFKDITADVLPPGIERYGVVAVAEIDFDNDGDFDLYVARTNTADLKWSPGAHFDDYLFENRNGKFVDVTERAGIPRGTGSRGVTVADFNNDGFMDLLVTQYSAPDILLMNQGDGTFARVDNLLYRPPGTRGDNAVAFDYDLDGRVDVISSQGDQHKVGYRGIYRLFRNKLPLTWYSRYLHVRVGSAPDESATALHAVVTVTVAGGARKVCQRVGTPGATVSTSFMETLHFGLGRHEYADSVEVVYSSGYKVRKTGVWHGRTVNMGVV